MVKKDGLIEQFERRIKKIVVEYSDQQLVEMYERCDDIRSTNDTCWLNKFQYIQFIEHLVEGELASRHPRRWKRFTEKPRDVRALRKIYLKD